MAVSLTAAEQAGVAAGDSTLDTAFGSGLQNPDTSQNTPALQGYAQSKVFGQPPTDVTPQIRGVFRSAWVALVRALSSFTEAYTEVLGGPGFQNSWVNFDNGVANGTAAFFKDPMGVVHLKGIIKSGTLGTVAFTLPAGYRPAKATLFACWSNAAFGGLQVDGTGNVTVLTGSNISFSLDGVSFRAVQ